MRLSVQLVVLVVIFWSLSGCEGGASTDEGNPNGGGESVSEAGDIDDGEEDVSTGTEQGDDAGSEAAEEDVVVVPFEPTFTGVMAHVITPYCASCHLTKDVEENGELDFEISEVYVQLINVQAVEAPAKIRVIPGDPDNSFLVQKLENTQGFFEGDMMPSPPSSPLDPELIQLVRDWILDDAQDN